MTIKNPICFKFERRINDEIAAGQQFEYLHIDGLKQQTLTETAKRMMVVPATETRTLYDVARPAIDVLCKLRFIYLLSLLEAFGKEYIATHDKVNRADLGSHLSAETSAWQKTYKARRHYNSTSLYNTPFLAFVLTGKYKIAFGGDISGNFWEIGPLRNCVVHDEGIIADDAIRGELRSTIATTNTVDAVAELITIDDKLLWILIEDSRRFLKACDI